MADAAEMWLETIRRQESLSTFKLSWRDCLVVSVPLADDLRFFSELLRDPC